MDGGAVEVADVDGIRRITLVNPAKRNALDEAMITELAGALRLPPEARVVLVRGGGEKSFCSGYDLAGLEVPEGPLPDRRLMEMLRALQELSVPTVALVEGPAFGAGCDLALACDFRVGGPDAVFCMPPARLGLVYSPDGLWRLARAVGWAYAKLMFLTGRRVGAGDASRVGLLDELCEEGAAEAAARLCAELAAGAPLAVTGMKKAFGMLSGPRPGVEGLEEIDRLRQQAFASEDAAEGVAAFVERRRPVFRGR